MNDMSRMSRYASLAVMLTTIVVPTGAEPAPATDSPRPPLPSGRVSVRPSGPPSRAREEARRRKQMARAGLPVVEPVPVDEAACVGVEGGGA